MKHTDKNIRFSLDLLHPAGEFFLHVAIGHTGEVLSVNQRLAFFVTVQIAQRQQNRERFMITVLVRDKSGVALSMTMSTLKIECELDIGSLYLRDK